MDDVNASASVETAFAAFDDRYRQRQRHAEEIQSTNKTALFDALAAANITLVTVTFDGVGDSGQIESIDVRSGGAGLEPDSVQQGREACEGQTSPEVDAQHGGTSTERKAESSLLSVQVEIATPLWDGSGTETHSLTMHDAIERLAYDLLEETHGGWENNEGAYGEFVFDVAGRTIRLEYNERVMETEYSEHEW